MAKLTIREKNRDRLYEICEEVVAIGSAPECNVILRDASASKRHCEIRKTKDGYRLVDLETKSGTRVNGEFVNQASLRTGDKVQIGDAAILFEGKSRPAPAHVPHVAERTRRLAEKRSGLPPNAVVGLVISGIALIVLVIVLGFNRRPWENPDEIIMKQAQAMVKTNRHEEALAKLKEIDLLPPDQRTPWVAQMRARTEVEIAGVLQQSNDARAKGKAEREMGEIVRYAYEHPKDVDEINKRLDAWHKSYEKLLSSLGPQVAKYNEIRDRYKERAPVEPPKKEPDPFDELDTEG